MCGGVAYELSPVCGWAGGAVLDEEKATEWIRRLAGNVDTLCYEVVGVSKDHLRGVEWLNGVGRKARDECVVADMQRVDVVTEVGELMEKPECLWFQVDVVGGGGRLAAPLPLLMMGMWWRGRVWLRLWA